ncbi:hypothetical protein, partial [Zoogloea sp. LCSB751]|uniref:hypothetical protein n=1 Tax=Zoogloea sp. LCSB751 TaxID=1965277 RepID=UPI001C1F459F
MASKEALSASMQAAQQSTPPPPAVMPDAVQRELNTNTLMGSLAAPMETERRIDVSAHDVDARVF